MCNGERERELGNRSPQPRNDILPRVTYEYNRGVSVKRDIRVQGVSDTTHRTDISSGRNRTVRVISADVGAACYAKKTETRALARIAEPISTRA